MAISTATILSAVTLTAAAEQQTNPAQSDQSAKDWKQFTVQAVVTNGLSASAQNRLLRCWVACCNESVAADGAGTIAQKLRSVARPYNFTLTKPASAVSVLVTPPIPFIGGYIAVWTDHEAWDLAATLTSLKAVQAA